MERKRDLNFFFFPFVLVRVYAKGVIRGKFFFLIIRAILW